LLTRSRRFYGSWLSRIDPETAYLLREREGGEKAAAEHGLSARPTLLSDTDGGGSLKREETLEQVIAQARRTPRFWSLDNPVLVATALSLGGAALFGSVH
jgi:hypothetical protein